MKHYDAGKGDAPRPVDKKKFDANFAEIDWGKFEPKIEAVPLTPEQWNNMVSAESCASAPAIADKDFYKRQGLNLEITGYTMCHPGWTDEAGQPLLNPPPAQLCEHCGADLRHCRRPVDGGPYCLDCWLVIGDKPPQRRLQDEILYGAHVVEVPAPPGCERYDPEDPGWASWLTRFAEAAEIVEVFYYYGRGRYEGHGHALLVNSKGQVQDLSLSHCSCYGPLERAYPAYDRWKSFAAFQKSLSAGNHEWTTIIAQARRRGSKVKGGRRC